MNKIEKIIDKLLDINIKMINLSKKDYEAMLLLQEIVKNQNKRIKKLENESNRN